MTEPGLRVSPLGSEPLGELVEVWNAAAGRAFLLREALFRQNTVDDPHFDPAGCVVARAGAPGTIVGFCLAKVARVPLGADGILPDRGWISMLAVRPSAQRRGVATALLAAAEAYLRGRGRQRIVLGSDPAHFFPGVPEGTPAVPFFSRAGYTLRGIAYDLRRALTDYRTPARVIATLAAHPEFEIRPLETGDRTSLFVFLDAAFPGRWRYGVARFLELGGSIGDILGVVREREVLGFAHLFHPHSAWIGPSVAWTVDPGRTGGLGPMGLSPAIRGRGLGHALLDRAAVRLGDLGVDEMVVDWTILVDFYGALGFAPFRRYRHGECRP